MAVAWRFFALLATVGEAMMYAPAAKDTLNAGNFTDKVGECRVKEGRLLFLHIMKAGGTSVDSFLACHCKRVGCSLQLSLGPLHFLHGNKNCERPAMCTTHGEYRNRKELCGDDFENPAKVITLFREPVSRVFSFYNYEKQQGWALPPLAELYEQCETGNLLAKSGEIEKIEKDKPIFYVCSQIMNQMVMNTFADKDLVYSSKWDQELVSQAKNVVAKLDATFFLEDFDRFVTAFGDAGLVEENYINKNDPTCELGHSNPTACPTCAKEPTALEVELIKRHNEMDLALYAFAKDLPNRQGH